MVCLSDKDLSETPCFFYRTGNFFLIALSVFVNRRVSVSGDGTVLRLVQGPDMLMMEGYRNTTEN